MNQKQAFLKLSRNLPPGVSLKIGRNLWLFAAIHPDHNTSDTFDLSIVFQGRVVHRQQSEDLREIVASAARHLSSMTSEVV